MRIVLIRHAQSLRNVTHAGKTFYRVGEKKNNVPNYKVPITAEGVNQARAVGKRLYNMHVTYGVDPVRMYHSGFKRAEHTASIIIDTMKELAEKNSHELSIPIEQDHLLRERDAGHAFEMDEGEAKKHFPYLSEHWSFEGKFFATPPGGESFVRVMDRVALFLHKMSTIDALRGKTVYAVTHGGTMLAFEMVVGKIPFDEGGRSVTLAKNCEIHSYCYEGGEWYREMENSPL
jgi:2,3-bisphosphoglycerate-dependent phosphoglycerate mutase